MAVQSSGMRAETCVYVFLIRSAKALLSLAFINQRICNSQVCIGLLGITKGIG